MIELTFIAGNFLDHELPKEKQYLLHYFRTELEQQFLRYLYCFGQYEHFTDHTGIFCQLRWLHMLKRRHDLLVDAHTEAKREIDLEALAEIETGKYSLEMIEQFKPRRKL